MGNVVEEEDGGEWWAFMREGKSGESLCQGSDHVVLRWMISFRYRWNMKTSLTDEVLQ